MNEKLDNVKKIIEDCEAAQKETKNYFRQMMMKVAAYKKIREELERKEKEWWS